MAAKAVTFVRNIAKMLIQRIILPAAYAVARLRRRGEKTLYVFADAHHTSLPFSLAAMYDHVVSLGIEPVCHFYDYTHEGAVKSLIHAVQFMDLLAQAKYVFICDTFLPVSSGRKARGTKVVQLCHFSGPFKKIGHATADDVPTYYKGSMYKNYDLVTASSQTFVPLLTDAMRQPEGVVMALGVSRSDVFYDPQWVENRREEFYSRYPDAKGKKILLWAPTFRGKAAQPDRLGNEAILSLREKLGEDWVVFIKHHPHDDAMEDNPLYRSNCTLPSENLLPVVDMLITDYSTTVLDYLAFEKPFVLYAPDLEEYERTRGFFIDYRSITKNMTGDAAQLASLVTAAYNDWQAGDREDILRCKSVYTAACDGKATARIMDYLRGMDAHSAEGGGSNEA